jgi:hypothetical protein
LDYNLIDVEMLAKVIYNQNFGATAEIEYHNVHLQNNFKMLIFAGYFALMPLILALDFFVI